MLIFTKSGYIRIFWLLCCFILLNEKSSAQSLNVQDTIVQPSSLVQVVKSVLVPGWGQMNQERLTESMFFYFSGATYYYRTFFHLYQYQKNERKINNVLFKVNLSAALFLHGLNILDAIDGAYYKKNPGWQGGLMNDKPQKSPWGATLRSAMLPGWGQAYNESYWKAAGYFLVDSYLIYKIREADVDYHSTGKSSYKEDRSRYAWYFGLAYLLTMADAHAGAYLYKFDEAMKLTIAPAIEQDRLWVGLYVQF